jgi:hypothetical protein
VIAALVVFPWTPAAVRAEQPQYTYIEGGFADIDRKGPLFDSGDQWFVGGSWNRGRGRVFAEYADAAFELDFGVPEVSGELEEQHWLVGAGWHGLLGERADVVAEGGYIDVDVKETIVIEGLGPTVLSAGDDGYFVRGGVRWRILPRLELDGSFDRIELDEAGDDEIIRIAVIGFLGRLGIGASFATADERDRIALFLRLNLGKR